MAQIVIEPSCPCIGKALVALQLGSSITVTSIQRDGSFLTPDGFTKIMAGDQLSVMTDNEVSMCKFNLIFGINT